MGENKKNKKFHQNVDNQEIKNEEKLNETVDKEETKEENFEEKFNELNDKYLRLYSEYDNYRKRTANEKIELIKTAAEGTILALLPVLDDFERALPTMEKIEDKTHYEGIALIYNKLKHALEQKGLEEIKATGETFNTDEHEALTQIPAPSEDMKDKVIDVIQKGYKLNGKVIRYARVVVGC
ncbi:MAG: nucleotide exchange factor GrpE [Bacteroidales bacterium]|nr:nucleotide exchange factor GrpE [Bacteroidales bacterium]